MAALVDTHCHLNFNLFKNDLTAVLERAWQKGLIRILIPGTDLASSQLAVQLSEVHPNLYAAVGFHPNDALTWIDSSLSELRKLVNHPKVAAIGEIGLDYYRQTAPHNVQKKILWEQLQLAGEYGKPVILHNRQSTTDLLQILRDWKAELIHENSSLADRPGVLHSFDGNLEDAQIATSLGFYIGIGGPITYHNARQNQSIVANLPLDNLLSETDSPFLTPHPYRGSRNEPAYVELITQKISDLHIRPLNEVAKIISHNADRLLAWRSID